MKWLRTCVLGMAIGAGALIAPAPASGDAPHPVEVGEYYVQGALGYQNFDRPDFKYVRLYQNDSSVSPTGAVTIVNPQGNLLSLGVKEKKEIIPEGTIGYGFENKLLEDFEGMLRIEFTGSMFETENSSFLASATPPASGFLIPDPGNPGTFVDVGLSGNYTAISGRNFNPDGNQAGFMSSLEIQNIALTVDEDRWNFGFMFYLDERFGGWESTRGAGLIYGYHAQDSRLSFIMPGLAAFDPGNTLGGDFSYRYKYSLTSHHIQFPFDFAFGRQLFAGISVYLTGTATIGLVVNDIQGLQEGPCLAACELTAPQILTRGFDKLDRQEVDFSFDTRGGGGVSWRVWKLRISGEAGAYYTNQYNQPRDVEAGKTVEAQPGVHWGYFGKASATVIF